MNGYKLPGVELTDVTDIQTPRPTSSQRVPCIIGTISPYKTVIYEELIKGSGSEILSMYSTGIVAILNAGAQRGLNNIEEGKDISVDKTTGEVTWLTTTENRSVESGVYGLNLFENIIDFSQLEEAMPGFNPTGGYAKVGLDKVASADTGLAPLTSYEFKVNGVAYTITTPDVPVITMQALSTLMHNAVSGDGFLGSFQVYDIVISNATLGAGSSILLEPGDSDDLFSALTDWSSFGDVVAGEDATAGYQEFGLIVNDTDDTGLAAETIYYFKANNKRYHILTGAGVTTYAALVALIDAVITDDDLTCTFETTDISVTSDVTGSSSLVSLGLVDDIQAQNNQLTLRLTTGVVYDYKPGRLEITCTIEGSPYTFGIADDLNAGDRDIVLSGTDSNLNLIKPGIEFTLTSKPPVSDGGRYFVSYTYNRPESDYIYREFTKSEDLKAELGANIPDNTAVMLGCLGFDYFNLSRIGFVPVKQSNQNSDYVEALQKCKNRTVETLAILNSSATVRNAAISHVTERNLPKNGKYRMYYTGAPELTPVGDIETPNSVAYISNSIKNESVVFVNATRGKVYYKDPVTKEDTFTVVDGAFIGAAVGLFRDSFTYPSQNLLRYIVPGIELFSEDFEDYYSDDALIAAGEGSAFLVGLGANNSVLVRDDLTTDNTSVEANNINIVTAKHYIAKDVTLQLDRTFIGSIVTNRPAYKLNIENFMYGLFASYTAGKIIENVAKIEVTLPPKRRDLVKVRYGYYAIYSNKYIEGEYYIAI